MDRMNINDIDYEWLISQININSDSGIYSQVHKIVKPDAAVMWLDSDIMKLIDALCELSPEIKKKYNESTQFRHFTMPLIRAMFKQ